MDTRNELDAVQQHAAFALKEDRAFLRVTGDDATRWLNGMVTNSAQALAPGEGNYNFLLNAQGRIQGDCLLFRDTVPATSAEFLLATDAAQIEPLRQHLERFIIMDDVELTPVYTGETTLLLLGPELPQHLAALHLSNPGPLRLSHASTPNGPVLLLAAETGPVPRIELRAGTAVIDALRQELQAAGVPQLSAITLEQLRILAGSPRFGVDIRDRELPQETNQVQALHFAKGCYLGQEIVERIRSRGQVHRTLTGFALIGLSPALPAVLSAEGKPVGEITSAVAIGQESGSELIGLGYLRRGALESGAALSYDGGTATVRSFAAPAKDSAVPTPDRIQSSDTSLKETHA